MNLVIDEQRLRTWAKIALLLFYFFVFGNWVVLLTSPDEGRNASAVLNMLKTWDLLVPHYNCEPRFEKLPMLYWVLFFLLRSLVLTNFFKACVGIVGSWASSELLSTGEEAFKRGVGKKKLPHPLNLSPSLVRRKSLRPRDVKHLFHGLCPLFFPF
jgi:hypothetical protein